MATRIELGTQINSGIRFREMSPISIVRTKSLFLKIKAKISFATIIKI